jgi:biopolymer transport protein ExbD
MYRTAPARTVRVADPVPTINTTPLIDVLLVLLIMIIMTLPVPTHKLPIDVPPPGPTKPAEPPHRLDIMANGALLWDGAALGDAALPERLKAIAAQPDGVLHMRTDPGASYNRFATVLDIVKRAGIEHLGFIGNEAMVERGASGTR